MSPYCAKVLSIELAKSDYDGMTADQGWAWLTAPVYQQTLQVPTGIRLTPIVAAGLIGATKANAMAAAVLATFPAIGHDLLTEGIDPTKDETKAFIAQLVAGKVITQDDADTLAASATQTVNMGLLQARFDERFQPKNWPSVADDGSIDPSGKSQAIHQFPNCLELQREDFDIAWKAAGRT